MRPRIQEPTNDSINLPSVGVREMGRKSDWIDLSGWILGTGMTFASFQHVGTNPSRIDALKMAHTGPESGVLKSRRTQLGKPSGPGAL